MAEHPWADDVAIVFNFEARGNSGPSCMFETNDLNHNVVNLFAQHAPHPRGPVDHGEERYSRQLEQARSKGHGLWRGAFVAPWDWARGQRLPEEKGG